jgi:GNAT superfamily N-acetyltransferase
MAGRNSRSDGERELIMEISHRSLTFDEAVRLHQALKDTPNILGYTVRELERLSDVYVAQVANESEENESEENEFAGACFSVDLRQGWTEIAALCVLPRFQGRGLGKALFEAAWNRAQDRRRHIYVLSRNPQVIEWMRAHEMQVDDRHLHAPAAVHWYMVRHMASWYRSKEGFRKRKTISQCPPLLQGMKKYTPKQKTSPQNGVPG